MVVLSSSCVLLFICLGRSHTVECTPGMHFGVPWMGHFHFGSMAPGYTYPFFSAYAHTEMLSHIISDQSGRLYNVPSKY